ncbi:MAG: phosphoribulokinase [Pseudodesulfovibrio sp.]|uniref:phosphoribulokinase n=1 Tax=Pseudodesulfovibrio aespoeensis (strain ATCC 700646 / DSM 10631 / Aspo-2) TaxID=643562 RepID=E6VVI7_PSEA9|nr:MULTISPECIES: phosphoribulokinase [Pseudodesulfovibrio]ADU63545.1 phosphoribulokinase [Pseudodesulfovibrio aespoeensis Aspo-2]MBV1772170.1 phosphoribulokinase [Pseudodesulfovibrio sp.]
MQRNRPILLGIVGDSAAGKTTISAGIEKILGPDRVTNICSDDYHKFNRVQRAEKNISALHPDCNYIDIMQHNFYQLRRGEAILKPVYNHHTGDFDPPVYIEPKEFVIVEGLLGFYTKKMRDAFDVKIYLDPDEELRVDWKFKRDTVKRGYTRDQVQASLDKRIDVSTNYIRPQRKFADIVCNFYRPDGAEEETGTNLNTNLILRPTIHHPDFAEFIDHRPGTKEKCLTFTLGRDEGLPVDILQITGNIKQMTAETLMDIIIDHLDKCDDLTIDGVGCYFEGDEEKTSYPLGITQLLTCYHLMNAKMNA